jgi:serine protease Do
MLISFSYNVINSKRFAKTLHNRLDFGVCMLLKKSISAFVLFSALMDSSSASICLPEIRVDIDNKPIKDDPGVKGKDEEKSEILKKLHESGITEEELFSVLNFSNVVKKITNSVVSIVAVQSPSEGDSEIDQFSKSFKGTPFEPFFRNFSGKDQPRKIRVGGSGFFIKMDKDVAYLVTNCHIVENIVRVKILLKDKTEIPATVHGSDPRTDLAVLSVNIKDIPEDQRSLIVPLEWGDSSKSEVGHWVLAIGNPFGLGNTVTHGIISAKSRDIQSQNAVTFTDDFIQHSAQINMGNSGGCLVNVCGQVIGINTVIITPSGGNVGIGFAIPSDNAKKIIDQLIKNKKVQHGALGVSIQDFSREMAEGLGITKYDKGAIIIGIEPDGPASSAGVKDGDVIVKFDDTIVTGKSKLSRVVGEANVNTVHKLLILRGNKEITISVTLGDFEKINGTLADKKSDDKPVEVLGAVLADPSSIGGKSASIEGVVVTKVNSDSPAEDTGIIPGDVIIEVNRTKVKTARDFKNIVLKAVKEKRRFVFLRVRHGEIDRFLSIKIDEDEVLSKEANNNKNTKKNASSSEQDNSKKDKQEKDKQEKDKQEKDKQEKDKQEKDKQEKDVGETSSGDEKNKNIDKGSLQSNTESEHAAQDAKKSDNSSKNDKKSNSMETRTSEQKAWTKNLKKGVNNFKGTIEGLFSSKEKNRDFYR